MEGNEEESLLSWINFIKMLCSLKISSATIGAYWTTTRLGMWHPLLTCERMLCHYPMAFTLMGFFPISHCDDQWHIMFLVPRLKWKSIIAGKLRRWIETLAHHSYPLLLLRFYDIKMACNSTSSSHERAVLELHYSANSGWS